MNKKAFTIVEFLIFIMMTMLLLVCINQMVLYINTQIKMHQRYCATWLQAMTAIDFLSRDIECAPCAVTQWKEVKSEALIWHKEPDKDIGWFVHNNKLVKIVGSYNQQVWTQKRKTIVLKDVPSIYYIIHKNNNYIIGITISISFTCNAKNYELKRKVMIRNRVIPCH